MKTQTIPIGATVRFRLAGRSFVGRVLQDRGPIGKGGRHLYLVRYEMGKGNWYSTELPPDEIEDIESPPVNVRRVPEIAAMIPVETIEAYSVVAKPEHARSLADFLRSQGVQLNESISVDPNETHLLIDKSTPWEEFVTLLNSWKQQLAEE